MKTCAEYDKVLHCEIAERCSQNEFACCSMPQKCISIRRRCDSYLDCNDGADENNCQVKKNKLYSSMKAILSKTCFQASCGIAQFACVKSGRCIPAEKRCDGIADDCADGSNLDEIGCTKNTTCIGKFMCDSGLSKAVMGDLSCIDYSKNCDGVKDCPNGEDEMNCSK
ncbi:unnamed protein product [Anisakis simplex]|uniref:Low-density lipoprotein receptor domain class A n=1 Tax=Anisakis simplex TaxID=6269 RepID=A0A0M3KA92_ANISI|nr:unnamed protein product [Anisakis simplex]